MKLKWKIALFGILLVSISSLVLFYFSSEMAQRELKTQILENLQSRAQSEMAFVDRFFQQRKSDIQTAALNPVLRSRDRFSPEELTSLLKELNQVNNLYYSFSFFDTNRVRLADSKSLSIGKMHRNSLYWQKIDFQHPNGNFVVDISLSESIGKLVVHFATIVYDYKKRPTGVLVSRVLLERLYDVFTQTQGNDRSFLSPKIDLIDENGKILYCNKAGPQVFGRPFMDIPPDKLQANPQGGIFESENKIQVWLKDQGYLNYEGQGWILSYGLNRNQALLSLNDLVKTLLLGLFLVIGSALVVTLLVSQVVTRPIANLTNSAQQLANGELNTSFIVRTGDEIQTLGLQLQKMAKTLKTRLEEQAILLNDISQKNKKITDSIQYARQLQQSILPQQSVFQNAFADYFIFYKPKDIVSGDFYYARQIHGKTYLIVADCTGHGVSGAFMSLIGYNGLVNLIEISGLNSPSQILFGLNQYLLHQLNGTHSEKMGMEIGILVVDSEAGQIHFAGAGIPLYWHHNEELTKIKPKRRSLGSVWTDTQLEPEEFTIEIKPGMRIFMSTDGYRDQIGGPKEAKFMSHRFESLLKNMQRIPLHEQGREVSQSMEKWMGENPQLDDMLWLGVEIKT
jgi:serine phosphatase RsbU (regulator of sigma subunit)